VHRKAVRSSSVIRRRTSGQVVTTYGIQRPHNHGSVTVGWSPYPSISSHSTDALAEMNNHRAPGVTLRPQTWQRPSTRRASTERQLCGSFGAGPLHGPEFQHRLEVVVVRLFSRDAALTSNVRMLHAAVVTRTPVGAMPL
jgi:hypothetical protein